MAELKWFGRKQIEAALMNGFSPVPGYEYRPGEYAFLLMSEDVRRNRVEASTLASQLKGVKREKISNMSAATRGRKCPKRGLSRGKWAAFRASLNPDLAKRQEVPA